MFKYYFGNINVELAYSTEVNEKNDVYSFGVLSLEVVMGSHPGDFISSFSSYQSSSSSSLANRDMLLNDLLDQRLSPPMNQVAMEMILVLKLAFKCLHPSPRYRPNMQQVSVQLMKECQPLKSSLQIHTLGQLLDMESPAS